MTTKIEKKDPRIRASRPFKLKDHPETRRSQILDLKHVFGFLPEFIVVAKMPGQNNHISVVAVLTEEEEKKEDAAKMKAKTFKGVKLAERKSPKGKLVLDK